MRSFAHSPLKSHAPIHIKLTAGETEPTNTEAAIAENAVI